MPHPYHLVSAQTVTHAELCQFIKEQGGDTDPDGVYDGGVYKQGTLARVWIKWATEREWEYLRDVENAPPGKAQDDEREEARTLLKLITESLGAPPETYVFLDVLKNRPSERLALKFIKAFSQRWGPCVFHNFRPLGTSSSGKDVWTTQELLAFSGSHGGLPR